MHGTLYDRMLNSSSTVFECFETGVEVEIPADVRLKAAGYVIAQGGELVHWIKIAGFCWRVVE